MTDRSFRIFIPTCPVLGSWGPSPVTRQEDDVLGTSDPYRERDTHSGVPLVFRESTVRVDRRLDSSVEGRLDRFLTFYIQSLLTVRSSCPRSWSSLFNLEVHSLWRHAFFRTEASPRVLYPRIVTGQRSEDNVWWLETMEEVVFSPVRNWNHFRFLSGDTFTQINP